MGVIKLCTYNPLKMRVVVGSQLASYGLLCFLWGCSQCLEIGKNPWRFLELVSFPKTDVVGSQLSTQDAKPRHHQDGGWNIFRWVGIPNLNWLICDDCILGGGWSNTSYHHVVLSIFFLISLQSYVLIHLQLSKPSWISRQMCISQLAIQIPTDQKKQGQLFRKAPRKKKQQTNSQTPKNLEKTAVWHLQVLRIVDGFANHPTNEVEKVQVVSSDIRPPSRDPGRSLLGFGSF